MRVRPCFHFISGRSRLGQGLGRNIKPAVVSKTSRGLTPSGKPEMRIAFFSTMGGLPWGGSEELWSRAAMVLLQRGHEVAFNCIRWASVAEPLAHLISGGAQAHFRSRRRMGRTLRQTLQKLRLTRLKYMGWLRKCRPDFVVISFSCHTDEPQIANTCRAMGI